MFPAIFAFLCWFSSTALMALAGYLIAFAAQRPEMAALSLGVVGVRFFGLSRGAFRYVERLSSHSLAFAALKKFRLSMYKFLEPLVPYKLPKFMTEAELLSRICQDVEEKEAWLPRAGVPLFACAASVTVSVFVLAYFHLHYAVCFLSVAFFVFAISAIAFFIMKIRTEEWGRASEELSNFSFSVSQGMAEKKSWGIFGNISQKWQILGLAEEGKRKKLYELYTITEMISVSAPFICLAGFFVIGAKEFSFQIWIAVLLGTLAAFELLQELPFVALQSALSLEAKKRINAIIKSKPSSTRLPYSLEQNNQQELSISKSDALLLSAPSGTGKTLLANAIVGFLPNELVYGNNDFKIERTEKFVFLEQENFLFTGTVLENLRFASPNASRGEMQKTLKQVGLEKIPLDLWIGERGFGLSGGERQKLCAARAKLYAEIHRCELVLADEPAAHLPLQDELKIFNSFTESPHKPAILWLSHTVPMKG